MKIALLTWFDNQNYGSSLQAFALRNKLSEFGKCDIIPYKTQGPGLKYTRILKKGLNGTLLSIKEKIVKILNKDIQEAEQKKRNKMLDYFASCLHIKNTHIEASELSEITELYEAFVCGSDQIWNPDTFDENFMLSFVPTEKKIISYAPSFGVTELYCEEAKIETYKRCLNKFNAISVREPEGKDIIKKLINRDAEILCDPCSLLSSEEWFKFAGENKEKENYVFTLFLTPNNQHLNAAHNVAEKVNSKVKLLAYSSIDYTQNVDQFRSLSPMEFVKAIRDAKFVCTDSFHATLFSIIFHKPFIVYSRFADNSKHSQNSRIYHLLKATGLEKRLDMNFDSKDLHNIEFKKADEYFVKSRIKTNEYLKKALLNE